jgi:hypothetical protein
MKSFVRLVTVFSLALSLMCLGLSGTANALPSLQLDIDGGYYDTSTETTMATTNPFNLYAFATPKGQLSSTDITNSTSYWLSVALTPKTSDSGTYGSFSINGADINVTVDMEYGTPLINSIGKDKQDHGIFDTYYQEFAVDFVEGDQATKYNVQDEIGDPNISGSGMYYDMFEINMAALEGDFGLHFDLYSKAADGSIDDFAPFSHDAGGTPVPEPTTLLLFGSGLAALVIFRRRQDRK